MNYQLSHPDNNVILRLNENGIITAIPICPGNTSYDTYLEWLAEGNEPLPADQEANP